MVLEVEKFSTLLASCCRVEVVKGRGALRVRSDFLTSVICHSASSMPASRASISPLLLITAFSALPLSPIRP